MARWRRRLILATLVGVVVGLQQLVALPATSAASTLDSTTTVTATPTISAAPTGTTTAVKSNTTATVTGTPSISPNSTATPTATATSGSNVQATATATTTSTVQATPTPTLIPSQAGEAVTYQINPAHTGAVTTTGLSVPLIQQWSVNLGAPASYPLIAQGKVYLTTSNPSGSGTLVYALDATTGQTVWGPIADPSAYAWSAAAYDAGRLFVLNYDGLLRAFDASSGAASWSVQMPGQYSFTSPPVALEGTVYLSGAGSGGTLYAVSEASGAVQWTDAVQNGDDSSPALSTDGAFVSYPCQDYKFDRASGAVDWHDNGPCEGGGGNTPVYYNGRVYVLDWNGTPSTGAILDATSGALLGNLQADSPPAFLNTTGFYRSGGALIATDLGSGSALWTFTANNTVSSMPIVVNGLVYVGASTGTVYALDPGSGAVLWSADVGASVPAQNLSTVGQPPSGLGAGDGLLVVPAGNLVVGYTQVPPPTATPAPTFTATPTATATFSPTLTATPANTATATPSATPTPRRHGPK